LRSETVQGERRRGGSRRTKRFDVNLTASPRICSIFSYHYDSLVGFRVCCAGLAFGRDPTGQCLGDHGNDQRALQVSVVARSAESQACHIPHFLAEIVLMANIHDVGNSGYDLGQAIWKTGTVTVERVARCGELPTRAFPGMGDGREDLAEGSACHKPTQELRNTYFAARFVFVEGTTDAAMDAPFSIAESRALSALDAAVLRFFANGAKVSGAGCAFWTASIVS
jgi:hypothetical protein